jgi:hypothetical protein
MTARCHPLLALPALVAAANLAAPAPAAAHVMMVPICGEFGGRAVPIRLPGRENPAGNSQACKICHIAMRKRSGADSCCGWEDDTDAA